MADRNGYIGRAPSDSSVTIARQTNQPTGIQTAFVFSSGYDVGLLDVYVNGSKLVNALDYTATDTQNVTLTTPAQGGDVVEFVAYKAFSITNVVTAATGDLTVDGSVTATGNVSGLSFIGDGSQLTGIDATALKDNNGDVRIQANTFGAVVTGILTANVSADTLAVSGVSTFGGAVFSGIVTTTSLNVTGVTTSTIKNSIIENYSEPVVVIGNTGSSQTFALGSGNYFTATLNQNSTFAFTTTGVPSGSVTFIIQLKNGSGGPFSITWPNSIEWPAGVTPARTTTAGRTDIWTFMTTDGGTNWLGNLAINNYNI